MEIKLIQDIKVHDDAGTILPKGSMFDNVSFTETGAFVNLSSSRQLFIYDDEFEVIV